MTSAEWNICIIVRGLQEGDNGVPECTGHYITQNALYLKVIRVLPVIFINVFLKQSQRIPDEEESIMARQLFIDAWRRKTKLNTNAFVMFSQNSRNRCKKAAKNFIG